MDKEIIALVITVLGGIVANWIKNAQTEGEWPANVDGTTVYYDFNNIDGKSELNLSGKWYLWPVIVFEDGRINRGNSVLIIVLPEKG